LGLAVLGGTTKVPAIDEDIDVQIKPGTQNGDKIVLFGKGLNSSGNLYVHLDVVIPSSSELSKKQLDIVYTLDNRTNPGSRSQLFTMFLRTIDFFWQKVRRFQQ